jgi:hypothetical protein
MPKATLTELFAEGMTVYPPGMRGLAASPPRVPRRGLPKGTPIKPEAGRKFAHWIKGEFPALYADAARRSGFAGLGQDAKAGVPTTTAVAEQPSALQRFVTTITSLAPQYLQYRAQKDLLDVQLDRARQGLPPLRPTDYAPAVQLSVDPAMYTPQLDALKPWLLYGGLALGGFLLFRMLGSRRR